MSAFVIVLIVCVVLALVLIGLAVCLAVRGNREEMARQARREYCIVDEPQ